MNWQKAFLSKVILDEEIKEAVNAGITDKFFRDEQYARVYQFMLAHWAQHGTAPDVDVVRQSYPTLQWEPQKQALSYLIERMRADRKLVLLTQGLNDAASHLQTEDSDRMSDVLSAALLQSKLETSPSRDMDLTTNWEAYDEILQDRMENPGFLRGISTGFHGIDYVTGGFQPEQFIVLLGTPKSFKSATLLAMAKAAHQQGKRALFSGYEMASQEQVDRLASLYSGVSLNKILHGSLSPKEYRIVQRAMQALAAMRPFIFSTDITAGTTVGALQAKIVDYQPDVVFVDGAYLMQSEEPGVIPGSPQAITSVSRGLKRLAQQQKVPICVTTQATLTRSRNGLTIHSAMYSQAWGQDCDVMLGVERQVAEDTDPEDLAGPVSVKFRVLESRSGPRKDVMLEWDWAIGSVEELDPGRIRELLNLHKHTSYGDTNGDQTDG